MALDSACRIASFPSVLWMRQEIDVSFPVDLRRVLLARRTGHGRRCEHQRIKIDPFSGVSQRL
jgi:hypothetical protein